MPRMTEELTRPQPREIATATRETLEDYTLRFAPRSYRKWSPGVVGVTALGGIAYLADFAIGANIGISYGTTNALWGILVFAVVIVLTGIPLAYYAARYNLDLDLITRGSGFGYYGSVVTNVIFATFTFIFFALEGSIMAQGLQLGLGIPLWLGYAVSTLIIFPLVVYGMTVLSKLQLWTTPLWLVLMVAPFAYLLISHPDSVASFFAYQGESGQGAPNLGSVMLAAGVCLSLIAQIAEQIDYLRFMPPRTPENARRWWTAVLLAGPGWVIFGAIKQVVGLFLAVYLIANVADGAAVANQPVHQFLEIYRDMMPRVARDDPRRGPRRDQPDQDQRDERVLRLAGLDQLVHPRHPDLPGPAGVPRRQPGHRARADGSEHVRLPQHDPGLLRQLRHVLGGRRGHRHRRQQVPAEALPDRPEFRRGMLYAVNPVGFGSMLVSAGVSIAVFFGAFGADGRSRSRRWWRSCSRSCCRRCWRSPPKGRYYLRRTDDGIDLPMYDELRQPLRRRAALPRLRPGLRAAGRAPPAAHDAHVCSLCLCTDKTGEHVLPAT